ncbi:unnamed protein product [Somion occarium]|uniref:Fungal-type protein kinase domain-containing protein n=1 Tax=Somion occarium TaxID=3059160 RepID=A0ABP1CT33_9APHY
MDTKYVSGRNPTAEEAAEFLKFTADDLNVTKETDIYAPLCKVMQSALPEGTLVCKDTGDWADESAPASTSAHWTGDRPSGKKIDICFYEDNQAVLDAVAVNPTTTTVTDTDRLANMGRVAWTEVVAFLEAKVTVDIFGMKPSRPFLPSSVDATSMRGQIAEYAAEILLQQHRTHVFMIFVYQDTARLVRFDRAGAIVSDFFNLVTEPMKLLNFVFRLGRMSPSERGFDDNVVLASGAEVELMKNHLPPQTDQTRLATHIRNALSSESRIHKITVPGKNGGNAQRFLVGKLRAGSRYPTGRGTKGYIAFDLQKPRFVFVKEGWRIDSDDVTSEMDIYAQLEKNHVEHVPTVVCGGDVGTPVQRTVSQSLLTASSEVTFAARIHYRIVLEEIGLPLEEHVRGEELSLAVYYCILAHKQAYEKAGTLHRDISPGNILINPNDEDPQKSKGILIDWDLAKTVEQLKMMPTQHERSGTWYYLSGLLLNYPKKPYELSDDLESFVHVINMQNLRFRHHDKSPCKEDKSDLSDHLFHVYQKTKVVQGFHMGSKDKLTQMKSGVPPYTITVHSNMSILVEGLMKMCQEHYAALDWDGLAKYAVKEDVPEPVELSDPRPRVPKSRTAFPVPKRIALVPTIPEEDEAQPQQALEPQPQPPTEPPKKLLDTHEHIESVFAIALNMNNWPPNDKMPDQFIGLPYGGPAPETGKGACTPSREVSHSKRKSVHSTGDASGEDLLWILAYITHRPVCRE